MQGGVPQANGGGAAPDRFAEFGGVDPNLEPELAMALKVSLEEERDRLKSDTDKPVEANANQPEIPNNQPESQIDENASMDEDEDEEEEYDEEAMIAKALAMSMPENEEPKQELKDIMTSDFMQEIIDGMGLDINENDKQEILKESGAD